MKAPYVGQFEPAHPCRQMPTRHCPASYGTVCGDRPCARHESEDPTPWYPELGELTSEQHLLVYKAGFPLHTSEQVARYQAVGLMGKHLRADRPGAVIEGPMKIEVIRTPEHDAAGEFLVKIVAQWHYGAGSAGAGERPAPADPVEPV